jgi:asparagine synthase (glutamine-hydrolysing)
MCGIAGILVADGHPIDGRILAEMTRSLAARGPDGEAFFTEGPIGLGHRRLAIIDVEGGRQPLYSEDRQVAVIANGEIYNFMDLRPELERAGHCFVTRSDSEVLVHGYEEWGDELLDRIEGMFALAIWDGKARKLLLARDRMGEKPLYWAELPGHGLAFASELRALERCPGVDSAIDPTALARYLVYECVPAPGTILRGMKKLEPGTKLVAKVGQPPVVSRYWDLPLADGARISDLDGAAEQLLAELRRSVRQRLVSDVPVGLFLSGGLDSSSVSALAAELRGGDLDTFSIGFEDPTYDESAEAERVAKAIGSRHHKERLRAEVLRDLLPSVGRLLDEPIGDGSIVPTHLLARFARQHVTVALGGDGGDELFAGYPTFIAERAALLLDHAPRPLVKMGAVALQTAARALPVASSYFSFDFKLKQLAKGMALPAVHRHQAWLGSFSPEEARAVLMPDVARLVQQNAYGLIDERLSRVASTDPWDRLLAFYAKNYLADQVLTKVDRATMAVGLEARAPLLDTKVVTLACRLLPALRSRGFATKRVFKHAMRGIVPEKTLQRSKQGFAMPIAGWLRNELRGWMEEALSEARLSRTGLFSPSAVRRLVDEHTAGRANHRKPLWTLLAFQTWLDSRAGA